MTREHAESIYGRVKVWMTGGPRSMQFGAYFDDWLDYDMPGWSQAFAQTESEAIATLLEQAAEHHAERTEGDNGESREWLSGMDLLGRNL